MINFAYGEDEEKQKDSRKQNQDFLKKLKKTHNKFCINCGTVLNEGDIFCTECGKKIEEEINEPEEIFVPEQKFEEKRISSDRMNSILQTKMHTQGTFDENVKEIVSKNFDSFNTKLSEKRVDYISKNKKNYQGIYVYKDNEKTMYLQINEYFGNNITATIKSLFTDGGFSTECYDGTISNGNIVLSLSNYDLHPLPPRKETKFSRIFVNTRTITSTIFTSESFIGKITEDSITGIFNGDYKAQVVFYRA